MKGLKKLSLLLVMMLTTTLLYGCGGPSPTDVVNEYFKKMQNGDVDVQKLFAMAEEGTK